MQGRQQFTLPKGSAAARHALGVSLANAYVRFVAIRLMWLAGLLGALQSSGRCGGS